MRVPFAATAISLAVLVATPTFLSPMPAEGAIPSGETFYAVALDNHDQFGVRPVSIAVANPGLQPATVTGTPCGGVAATTIVPASSSSEPFPTVIPIIGTSFLGSEIVKVVSSRPVGVSQHVENGEFRDDASQLLPVSEWGTRYTVTTYANLQGSFVTVIADSPTVVTITPSASTDAGGGWPALPAGSTASFTLGACHGLQLQSPGDLTGTVITSTQPVAVFAGSICVLVPNPVLYCNHLEEQLWPDSSWGLEYALCRTPQRASEPDVIRVQPVSGSATVTYGSTTIGIMAGDFHEFTILDDVLVQSDRPISLYQFTQGGDTNPSVHGDPTMTQVLPTRSLVPAYAMHHFLTPTGSQEFVILSISPNTQAMLDGAFVSGSPIAGGNGYQCARVPVTSSGYHAVTATGPVGAIYGAYSRADGYLAPAFSTAGGCPDGTLGQAPSCVPECLQGPEGAWPKCDCPSPTVGTMPDCDLICRPDLASPIVPDRPGSAASPMGIPPPAPYDVRFVVTHGWVGGVVSGKACAYNVQTMLWQRLPDAAVPRTSVAGINENPWEYTSKFYAVGGSGPFCSGPGQTCTTVEILSPLNNPGWSTGPPLSVPRAGLGLVSGVDMAGSTVVLAMGGRQCGSPGCGPSLAVVEAIVPGPGLVVPSMPIPRADFATAMDNSNPFQCGLAYVVGGMSAPGGGDLASVDVLDMCNLVWMSPGTIPNMPIGVSNAVAGFCNGRLVVVGGTNSGSPVLTVQTFDPLSGWQQTFFAGVNQAFAAGSGALLAPTAGTFSARVLAGAYPGSLVDQVSC